MSDPSLEEWGELLRHNWEKRARSGARDFFVASHPGWQDAERWKEQARMDLALLLHGIDTDAMGGWQVLDIGCGVGRLALPIAPLVQGYTGIDIAPGMLEEARKRCRELPNARFVQTDGTGFPREVRDRMYDLIFSVGVLIHCPRPVIDSLLRDAYTLLAPGGQLRVQVLADESDPEGFPTPEEATEETRQDLEQVKSANQEVEDEVTDEMRELIEDQYFMGHRFRYREFVECLGAIGTPEAATAVRVTPAHIFGLVEKR